ncbi:hypothetical protein [Breznakiella homolactica]|uniref:Tetratricopeptide repeat protein n=1 Tax=Breznakiella homolactica TaxID=2798577 RepID=A0A7T8BA96_9SPIR|nr:hypothetical protein [Breznakiella homolactica]QQO09287.1 hypothetical protein JFL75_20550 [Breznakiella homolactica]
MRLFSSFFDRISPRKAIKAACITGIVLSVILSAGMLTFALLSRGTFPGRKKQEASLPADSFYSALADYDRAAAGSPGAERLSRLDTMLTDLEEKALSVDSRLSLLKRRRRLTLEYPEYTGQYRLAALRALEVFPHSQPLAMAAAEAVLRENPAPFPADPRTAEELMDLADRISPEMEPVFVLALHILCGNAASPQTAAARIPQAERLFGSAAIRTAGVEQEELTFSSAVLKILNSNTDGALVQIENLLKGTNPSVTARYNAAELFYDYGDPLRAAVLFSPFEEPQSLVRQGDALYLAGHTDGARNIWKTLLAPGELPVSDHLTEKVLYNLAATARDSGESLGYLESLLRLKPDNISGIIRYSRYLPAMEAAAFLQSRSALLRDPLFDLEIHRRRTELQEIRRSAADTWLLIGRHPEDPRMYSWGAFYFDQQKLYGETEILFRNAEANAVRNPWLALHRALHAVLGGDLTAGEELLKSLIRTDQSPAGTEDWQIHANLGLLAEARRAPREALAYFETAAAFIPLPEAGTIPGQPVSRDAARLQLSIARCLLALGRTTDAQRVLEYASDLDPENLSVRLEIRRLREKMSL